MRIKELYGSYNGQDLYVVGTSPSTRVMPWSFLKGKVTLGLNQAYRHFSPTWSITVHPDLLVEYLALKKPNPTRWLVKKKPPLGEISLDDPRWYVFNTSEDLEVLSKRPADTLFQGRGVQQTAMDLAARMGARSIVLVGVDMCSLGNEHHGHAQHVRFLGLPADSVYREYRIWTRRVRKRLRTLGVEVLSLSPLLGGKDVEEDYLHLCKELGLSKLPKPRDVSTYKRKRIDS